MGPSCLAPGAGEVPWWRPRICWRAPLTWFLTLRSFYSRNDNIEMGESWGGRVPKGASRPVLGAGEGLPQQGHLS